MSIGAAEPAPLLSAAAARRVANQLERTFRGTYGAKTGLRAIVKVLARQMMRSGATQEAAAKTFERCVQEHPSCMGADDKNLVTGESRLQSLLELTDECVAEVALEFTAGAPPRMLESAATPRGQGR